MAKLQCSAKVTAVTPVAEGIISMWLLAPEIASFAVPGQFLSLYCKNKDTLLPRPISICETGRGEGTLRIVFRIAGAGTLEFSKMNAGEEIRILGPLGNGFPLSECPKGKRAILIGGGIGIPPLLQLSKEIKGDVTAVLGYRDADTFLLKEFQNAADRVVIATEDGSLGTEGNVIDAIRAEKISGDVIYSCGPAPMLRGVKEWGIKNRIPAWLSMEERMACGIGACLACVCQSTGVDPHSNVHNKRVCKDGPIFLSTDIEL